MGRKVSIIIPTYNRREFVGDTIRMACSQDYTDYEVIVVDQNSAALEVVHQAISDSAGLARLLRLETPSLTAARNAGVRASSGEIIVFIDDDVIIAPEYVKNHEKNYHDPQVGGVMGLTLPPEPVSEKEAIEATVRVFESVGKSGSGLVTVSWVIGCNASYRKAAIVQAGMSDERFTGSAWYEDADLSVRVRHLGYSLVFDPAVRLVHLEASAGGCENRTTTMGDEQRMETRCRLFLFFSLKNRMILGAQKTARNVWHIYRNVALNRPVLRSWKTALSRQRLFLRAVVGALRLLRTPCPSAESTN